MKHVTFKTFFSYKESKQESETFPCIGIKHSQLMYNYYSIQFFNKDVL